MRYGFVVLLSLGVGVLVYALSMRAAVTEPTAIGFEPEEPEEPAQLPTAAEGATRTVTGPPPGYTYLQVAVTTGPSLRERLQGLIGTVVLVAIGASAVAASIYAVGAAVNRVIRSFLGQ